MAFNSKEYSRLRSIARKRIERAAAAGKTEYQFIPTVAQVKKSEYPEQYMRAVQEFLSAPGSGLKWAKAEGIKVAVPKLPPAPAAEKLTDDQRRERKRIQNRLSKARAKIRQEYSDDDAKKRISFLKGFNTLVEKWSEINLPIAKWLSSLSPGKLKSFADYMEYRFSQGDYTQKYVIDKFVRDFGELSKTNYDISNIQNDFDAFLEKQKQLLKNKDKAEEYGLTAQEVDTAWTKFIKKQKRAKKTKR